MFRVSAGRSAAGGFAACAPLSLFLLILLLELALLTLIAQPPGWVMGYGLAWIMKTNLAGELMRVRLVVEHSTYVTASAVVLLAAIASAFIIRARINQLDLVAVLKTRD